MSDMVTFFEERISELNQKVETLTSKYNRFSIYRISAFLAFLILFIWSLNVELLALVMLSIGTFTVAFLWLVKRHNHIKEEKELHEKLVIINQEERGRLHFDFAKIADGAEFIDEHHPYTSDLDVFGRNSLFQLVNRAGSPIGVNMMKEWLEAPANQDEIQSRQQAVSELRSIVDWRQYLQAYGRQKVGSKNDENDFYGWLKGGDMINSSLVYRIIPYLLMVITGSMLAALLSGFLSFYYLLVPLAIGGYYLLQIVDYSKETYLMTESGVHLLESIEKMLHLIEIGQFKNERLLKLQQSLGADKERASERIGKLRKIFAWLSQRGNQMYHILNSVLLLDFILLAKAEKWRTKEKGEISVWFNVVAEFEVLSSIAAFAYANEGYVNPVISNTDFQLDARELGHPLIPPDQRVSNDYQLEGSGTTSVVTGSNMSGKSTFLRTIGINAVLAFCGAPVCAESLNLSIFRVFTSMRTKDNLEEHISSFYAELLRLKMLLDTISEDQSTLFLLDEILKGTNSVDRHTGAASLILQLNGLNAFGLVSTHDLELGNMQNENEKIKNYNFSSSIVEEEIVFDYKLREGICQSTNASQLMAKMGIKIKS